MARKDCVLNIVGRLCRDWELSENKKYRYNTIAVNVSDKQTEFIKVICNVATKDLEGYNKGVKVRAYGTPKIECTPKNKALITIFTDEVYVLEE